MRILVSLFSAVLAIPCFGQTFPQPGRHEAVSSSPEALAQITRESHALWGRLISDIGIKPQ